MIDRADWADRIRASLAAAGGAPDEDVVAELAEHATSVYSDALAQGATPDEAASRVTKDIEHWRMDAAGLKRKHDRVVQVEPPPVDGSSWFAGLVHDVRYALRLQRRQVKFAALVIGLTALGIGATAALFSVTYDVLVKPLPWPNAERVVSLTETRGGNTARVGGFTNVVYLAWQEEAATVDGLAAWSLGLAPSSPGPVTLTGDDDPERITTVSATASLFSVLGVQPLLGSLFVAEQETDRVVVLSESLWRRRFAADPNVVGRLASLDGQPYTVVGVVAEATMFPDRRTQAFVPLRVPHTPNGLLVLNALALPRPGTSLEQVGSEGTVRGAAAPNPELTSTGMFGSSGPVAVTATPLVDSLTRTVKTPLLVLLAAVALLLAAATANVANLQLARAMTRSRELALRAALGAGRARIYRQVLIENLVLGLAGGVIGVGVAWGLHRSLPALLPAAFPRTDDLALGPGVIALALLLAVVASAACTLILAVGLRHLDPRAVLAEDGRGSAGAMPRSPLGRARRFIMVVQVAIACVLLVGASLLGRSFVELLDADRGFDPSRVLGAHLAMPVSAFTPERRTAVLDEILERLDAVPATRGAAFTSASPIAPGGATASLDMQSPEGEQVIVQATLRVVSPGYFAALGLPIVGGRGFEESDTATSLPVVIANETFARRYPGEALGARVPSFRGRGSPAEAVVVGIAADVRYIDSPTESLPELYFSHRQLPAALGAFTTNITLLVRTDSNPGPSPTVFRNVVREADANLVPEAVMTLDDQLVVTNLALPRLYALLLGGFATLALLVAGVGLFGVLSYVVAQRTRELGIRAALGARPQDLLRLVLRQGLGTTIVGLAVGLVAAGVLMRFVTTLLYGVSAADLPTYVGVPVLLLVVAGAACIVPAHRAARLDPLRALRQ
jgi:putative ABC transport system permease protein